MFLFGRPDQIHIEMCVINLSFSLKASQRSGRSVLCALFLCFPVLPFLHPLRRFRFWFRCFRGYNDSPHYTCLFCHINRNQLNNSNFSNQEMAERFLHRTYFFILSYPIGSCSLVSSLQLPYGLERGEHREPCVLRKHDLAKPHCFLTHC
jgi:hypothetical protein